MRKSKKHNLDKLIQEAIHEQISNNSSPTLPVSVAWEQLSVAWEQLNEQLHETSKTRKVTWRKKYLYVASLVSVFVLFTVLLPQKGLAFTRLTEIFHKIEGAMVHLVTRAGDANKNVDAPSSDEFSFVEGSEVVTKQMSLDEAQEVTAFQIRVPQSLPQDFTLKNVTVLRKGTGTSEDIFLNYQGNQRGFVINEKLVKEQFGSGTIVDNEDTQVEQTNINGQKASMLLFKNGMIKVIWVTSSHYFSIEGKLTKEEITQIAKSM